jgi:hypothetical protein
MSSQKEFKIGNRVSALCFPDREVVGIISEIYEHFIVIQLDDGSKVQTVRALATHLSQPVNFTDKNHEEIWDLLVDLISEHKCANIDIARYILTVLYTDMTDVPGSYWEPKHDELHPLVQEALAITEEFYKKLSPIEDKMTEVYCKYDSGTIPR